MYTLFSQTPRSYGGLIVPSWFKETSARINEDVTHVIEYCRSRRFAVKSDHLLVKLIKTMSVPLKYELPRYYEVATARALYVANALEFTTAINPGKWFNGIFYYESPEIIIAHLNEDSPTELAKDWRNLTPVKVLDHPVSNLAYMLPNGMPHNTERGLAVIAIDIPMLMIQYRCWRELQDFNHEEGVLEQLSVAHFVAGYVLPNMLKSQTDIVISNRLMNLFYGAPMGDSLKKHIFHISNYSAWLDRGLNEVLSRISSLPMDYETILTQIPKIYSERPYQMPDIAETRQVWWALFITRFKLMRFLVDVAGEKGKSRNQVYVNALKIELRRFDSDKSLLNHLPEDMYQEVQYFAKHL